MAESRDRQHANTRLDSPIVERRLVAVPAGCRAICSRYAPCDTRTTGAAVTISLLATPALRPVVVYSLKGDRRGVARRESPATRRVERRRASNVATRFLTPFGGYVRASLVADVHTYERRGRRRRRCYRRLCAHDAPRATPTVVVASDTSGVVLGAHA